MNSVHIVVGDVLPTQMSQVVLKICPQHNSHKIMLLSALMKQVTHMKIMIKTKEKFRYVYTN